MLGNMIELKAQLERKRHQLQACHERFRVIMTRNRDGVLIVDRGKTIRFANPAAAAIFGCSEEELEGEAFAYPLDTDKTTELKIQARDGRTVQVEMWGVETEWNGEGARFVSLHDVTEHKLAEKALQLSEEKFAKVFRYVPSLLVVSSTLNEGRVIEVNEAFEKVFKYTREEAVGRSALDLNLWLDPEDRIRAIRTIREKGEERDREIKFRDKNGKVFVGLYSATIIEIGGEECLLSIMNDITERKRQAEEIEELNTDLAARALDLETANKELESFSYSVSHDLRRPLTTINGYCQVVLETCGSNLGEQCRGYVREIYDGTLRMNELIDALLNFSRLTRSELHRETVDLSAMAQVTAAELWQAEPGRRITFQIADGVVVKGDSNLLRVVLDNLLGNAWKYTGAREEAIISFGVMEIEGKPAWFVRDNGAGFDMADADKLFIPFQRLPGAEECRGFGIGLATVERIVSRHGGRVWAEGMPGKGATFYFTLSEDL